MKQTPLVSIGMPVFNGQDTIGVAIESLLSQSFKDFELIVSDNASTDCTADIVLSYAKMDSRIQYIKQKENLGAWPNFLYVLQQSKAKYFMWAAADDYRTEGFIASNLQLLESQPNTICSSAPNCWSGEEVAGVAATFELKGSLFNRYRGFIENCFTSHACFYSLIRRESLENCKEFTTDYLAMDWTVIVQLLSLGGFARTRGELLVLGRHGESQQPDFVEPLKLRSLKSFIPWFDFSRDFLSLIASSGELNVLQKTVLVLLVARFNLYRLVKQLQR